MSIFGNGSGHPELLRTAKDYLEWYTARSQFRITMTALAIYFIFVVVFMIVIDRVAKDNQLTIAVLLLQPITLGVGAGFAFWLQRSKGQEADKIAVTSWPNGTTTVGPAPPPPATPQGGTAQPGPTPPPTPTPAGAAVVITPPAAAGMAPDVALELRQDDIDGGRPAAG